MKKLTLITAIILTANLLFAQIINIPEDYPTIQEGINAASDGDTVLVAPDTYFENIIFNGKNIILASHYIINPDTSLISQTIIDGCQNSSVVEMDAGTLNGFTIINGYAHMGGGILCCCSVNSLLNLIICNNTAYFDPGVGAPGYGGGICLEYDASPTIENMVIKNNIGAVGGGIYCASSTPLLKDITIENNTAGLGSGFLGPGGGILFYDSEPIMKNITIRNNEASVAGGVYFWDSQPVFDSSELCNIYMNNDSMGNDLYSTNPVEIILDTFTVLQPTSYYVQPVEIFSFNILNGICGQVFDDVYVSPDGDNNNSGLTPDDPLQTISHTQAILYSDSISPRTIYLAEGIYSPSTNNEIFPVRIPDYANLTGTSESEVILDAESSERVITINGIANNFSYITITGTGTSENYNGAIYCYNSDPTLIQLTIKDNLTSGLYLYGSNPIILNTIISRNSAISGGGIYLYKSNPTILNTTITENSAGNKGGGILCGWSEPTIINTTITENSSGNYGGGIFCRSSVLMFLNSSISNNSAIMGGGIYSYVDNIIKVTNSILWENSPQEIYFDEQYGYSSSIEVSYSDIQGGETGIVINGNVTINWLEGNIDEDPLFEGTGDYPYMLSNESPCVNTGTPDTTGLNLPELDLAGNPRLYGGRIDMEAYENQEVVVTTKKSIHQLLNTDVEIHPNPAKNKISISVKDGVIIKEINIYNRVGQRVIHKKGETNTIDISMLPHGIYFIEIDINNRKVRSKVIIE